MLMRREVSIIETILVILKIEYRLKGAGRMQPRKLKCCIDETQSNRVSDFRDFMSSLFP